MLRHEPIQATLSGSIVAIAQVAVTELTVDAFSSLKTCTDR